MERYERKVAVVTGASSGIGAAILKILLRNGMKVVGLARRKEKIEEIGEEVGNCRNNLYAYKADVTKEEDVIEALKWTTQNVGPLSVLVNNAGVFKPGQIIDGDTNNWKVIVDTNLMGVAIACREAIKIMRSCDIRDGYIININSVAGQEFFDFPDGNLYMASKHGITSLTKQLRNELQNKKLPIRTSSVSPGYVVTELVAGNSSAQSVLSNGLHPEDIAEAVKCILSMRPEVEITELTIKPAASSL